MNRSILEGRLADLQAEYASGKQLLGERESQVVAIREQLLRIGGAIRLLSELLSQSGESQSASAEPEAAQEQGRAAHSPLAQ